MTINTGLILRKVLPCKKKEKRDLAPLVTCCKDFKPGRTSCLSLQEMDIVIIVINNNNDNNYNNNNNNNNNNDLL